jgi:MSHA biogenesis protein MshN
MSVINRMLQDLDRRNGRAVSSGSSPLADVRAVGAVRSGSEWFWRVIAGLMLVAAAWTIWVVYQLQPSSVATELAYRAAENTRRRAVAQSVPARQVAAVPASAAEPARPAGVSLPSPEPETLAAPIETLRLALTIDTPLAASAPRKPERVAGGRKPAVRSAGPASRERATSRPTAAAAHIEKRPRDRLPADSAENEFRRAAQLLQRGRVADAEEVLLAALEADATHQPARQTLIALYIEQGRLDDARGHLEQGLSLDPTHKPYALALARIHVDRAEYTRALDILGGANAGPQSGPDFHAMRGAILLRVGRHGEAADAYRLALGSGAQSGASWVGLGISLNELGRGPEAQEAFRRGIATGTLSDDLRAYAEQRIRQLR